MTATLTPPELQRYARHLILPEVGIAGQERLRGASVLLIGAGGLGSPAALYLAAAGIGRIGIVDDDVVDATNLQRQILHATGDVGRRKADSARERVTAANPHVEVELHPFRLDSSNALEIFSRYDLVVDGSDNFPTRYLVNDAAVLTGRTVVYGSIQRFEGQCSVFGAPGGPCYRCLFADPPPAGLVPSCAEAGVLGVLPGIIGTLQALEVIKQILGIGESLVGRLLLFDALALRFREIQLPRDPACPACGDEPTIDALIDYQDFCGLSGSQENDDSGDTMQDEIPEISVLDLKERLDRGDSITLVDVREPGEWEMGNLADHGAVHIPMGEVPDRADEIDPESEVVVYCRSGARSAQVAGFLLERGYERVHNMEGGILAWSDEIDSSIPKY